MGSEPNEPLPIAAIREEVVGERGPLVITAPTGSGKSTEVPRYLMDRGDSVIVVEPRRVACRALAARVAELEGSPLGERVGYQVRDDVRVSDATRIRFVTPGIALRQLEQVAASDVVVLDELHERRLDVDLLLALLRDRDDAQLVTMSATLDAARVRDYLGGRHLAAEGRLHEVEVRYRDGGLTLPASHQLTERVVSALDEAVESVDGDVLVFLPGKGEIADLESALSGRPFEIVPLHGSLSLDRQARVFRKTTRRKVVLATNVAETSLTVPGIALVIDSGLVRRTAYHRGRAHLALHPIASDAAEQRSGRAGRTGPGVAVRLWARRADLAERTPPEVHRESLVPLVLGAAAAGRSVEALDFLDAPKAHAVEAAREELRLLGAIDDDGITPIGEGLHGLPLDAPLGRLLLEARRSDDAALLQDAVDLVAALAAGRRLFSGEPSREPNDPRAAACDATAFILAVRGGGNDPARSEARRIAKRLREALGLGAPQHEAVDAAALRAIALRADPRSGHFARRRKRHLAFSSGGTEVALARESAAWLAVEPGQGETPAEALVVFEERAFGRGKDRRLLATCASPVSIAELRDSGIGRERVGKAKLVKGTIVATLERVHAGRVLAERDAVPEGQPARDAVVELFLAGRLHRKSRDESRRRLEIRTLAARLSHSRVGKGLGLPELDEPPPLEDWARARVEELGVESGADVALLSAEDFLADDLPFELRHIVDETFPRELDLGDARYRAVYDLEKRRVLLELTHGRRAKPPSAAFLPSFGGLTIMIEAGGTLHRVK